VRARSTSMSNISTISTLGLAGLAALVFVAGCSRQPSANEVVAATNPTVNEVAAVEPPAPGTPGGLPDDRTPVSEARFADTSAQGAANVVQTYYALLERGKYREARKLWAGGGKASGMGARAFADKFALYSEYHAQIGAPGPIEGAAGSLFVEVPVVLYGRLKTGGEFHRSGKAVLRRINNVPGSTAEQRKWRIERLELTG